MAESTPQKPKSKFSSIANGPDGEGLSKTLNHRRPLVVPNVVVTHEEETPLLDTKTLTGPDVCLKEVASEMKREVEDAIKQVLSPQNTRGMLFSMASYNERRPNSALNTTQGDLVRTESFRRVSECLKETETREREEKGRHLTHNVDKSKGKETEPKQDVHRRAKNRSKPSALNTMKSKIEGWWADVTNQQKTQTLGRRCKGSQLPSQQRTVNYLINLAAITCMFRSQHRV